jgi:hypothetical protein
LLPATSAATQSRYPPNRVPFGIEELAEIVSIAEQWAYSCEHGPHVAATVAPKGPRSNQMDGKRPVPPQFSVAWYQSFKFHEFHTEARPSAAALLGINEGRGRETACAERRGRLEALTIQRLRHRGDRLQALFVGLKSGATGFRGPSGGLDLPQTELLPPAC